MSTGDLIHKAMSYFDEKYCLEWKDFQTITSKSFGKLREDKVLFDVS